MSRTRIAFASTCPNCGHERVQHAYSRRILLSLLNRRSNIDAYCNECNVCWPISETERRGLAPRASALGYDPRRPVTTMTGNSAAEI